MSNPVVVIGGGEHARVVIEAIRAAAVAHEVLGFVDPEMCEETTRRLGVPRLGGEEVLQEHAGALGILGFAALDSRSRREEAARRLTPLLGGWALIVHGSAWVSPTASVGEGTVIMAGAVVQTGARIGAHCVVNTGAIVEHDAVLGDHAQLAPGVTLGGAVRIGSSAYIGLGALVRDHIVVGAGATVGMGAVVVRDVIAGARVMGVPAR
jgi:sugar O-acyltransferase (sialic acid O-acetyltransferase NeuD family)